MSKESGLKINPTGKELSTRDGSLSQAFLVDILASKTTDEAVAKIRPLNDKPWDIVRSAVARGYITLSTPDGKVHSRDKLPRGKAAVKAAPARRDRAAVSKKSFIDMKPKTKPAKVVAPRSPGRRVADKLVGKVVKAVIVQTDAVL